MISSIVKKFGEFLIGGVLFVGVLYAVTTSWKNDERLTVVGSDINSIKKSMVSLLLDENPDKPSIVKDLVSDANFIKGVESYKAGKYKNAYSMWEESASQGNRDSVYAIAVANDSLKEKLQSTSLSEQERKDIETALISAPEIKKQDGIYLMKDTKW